MEYPDLGIISHEVFMESRHIFPEKYRAFLDVFLNDMVVPAQFTLSGATEKFASGGRCMVTCTGTGLVWQGLLASKVISNFPLLEGNSGSQELF